MKQFFSKIGAVLMVLVLLLSTTSITIKLRYCNNDLVETGILSTADSYSVEENLACCLSLKTCCDVKQIVIVGQNELLPVTEVNQTFNNQYYAVKPLILYINCLDKQFDKDFFRKEYIPPNIVVEKYLINQVYLL